MKIKKIKILKLLILLFNLNLINNLIAIEKPNSQNLSKNDLNNKLKDLLKKLILPSRSNADFQNGLKLISDGADVNLTESGWSILVIAAEYGYKDIVEALLNKGANVNIQNAAGATPLMLAARGGHKDIVELLLNHNTNIDMKANYGMTALMEAAQSGYKDIVEFLLKKGANPNIQNNAGWTAAMYAVGPLNKRAGGDYKGIVEVLLKNGTDSNIKNNNGLTVKDMINKYWPKETWLEKIASEIGKTTKGVINKVVNIGNTTLSCTEVAGMTVASFAKNTGIDVAKAGVETAKVLAKDTALNTARDSLKFADKTLDAANSVAQGFLDTIDLLGKLLNNGFNIKCIRFYGSLKEIQFELIATILGQDITVNERLNVGKIEDLAKKLFDIIKDKGADILKSTKIASFFK